MHAAWQLDNPGKEKHHSHGHLCVQFGPGALVFETRNGQPAEVCTRVSQKSEMHTPISSTYNGANMVLQRGMSLGSFIEKKAWAACSMMAMDGRHPTCLQARPITSAFAFRSPGSCVKRNKLHKNTQTHKTDQTSELIKQMASCDLGLFRGIFGRRDDNAMFPSHGAYMWVIRPGSCQ